MFNFIKSIFGSNTTQNDVSSSPLTGVMIDNTDSKGNVVSQKLFERFDIVGESFQKNNIKKLVNVSPKQHWYHTYIRVLLQLRLWLMV